MSIEDRSLDALKKEDTAEVIDASDRQWTTSDLLQLESQNDEGTSVSGHYMWTDGSSVFTNAAKTNKKAFFWTHTFSEYDVTKSIYHQFVILENKSGSVVAINREDDTVIAKNLPKPVTEFNTFSEVKNDHPEVLFYKVAKEKGSELFFLKSCLDGKGRILGFDEKGHPINTNQMHEKKEALKKDVFPKEILFRII